MSERLQSIINGINDGSIKFIYGLDLTVDDLFTKDNNGMYFLEYLLKSDIMLPSKLKDGIKSNPLAAYLFCKYDKSLFGFKLSDRDLFTEFGNKRLIEYLLENKKISRSLIEGICENIEIVDLLCNTNNYQYLNYLSKDIISKLITKDNNGIYPIEKYLGNKRFMDKIIPFINNIDVLLDICSRSNNYDLMRGANSRMLMSDYNDEKTVLQFLLDNSIIPDCLKNIPDDIVFVKYLISNNLYDYLKNARESVLLMEVSPSKTLLEFLIENGYDPEMGIIFNAKTINILYKMNRLDLIGDIYDDILLTSVVELFNDDSLEDKSLFEYLIDNGYDISNVKLKDEKLLRICYLKGRADLLEKADISSLLKPIDDIYTYFDYLLDAIMNKGIKVKVTSLIYSSSVSDYIKYYTTIAKHDMMQYIKEIDSECLLKKYDDRTLLEYLLDYDTELTLNKILNKRLKADPGIAIILKNRGIVQKNVDVVKEKSNYTMEYIEDINSHLGTGPLVEDGERLLNELRELFLMDGKSDKDIVNGLLVGYRNALMVNYDVNIEEVKKLLEIKRENMDRFCYIKSDNSSYFSPSSGSIFCENANTNTLLHETGHALHYYLTDGMVPLQYLDIVEDARQNPMVLDKTEEYVSNYKELLNSVTLLARQRYTSFFNDYYSDKKVEEIKNSLIKSKSLKKEEFKDLKIPEEQLEVILSDMYTPEEYIEHQKRIFINENVDAILRNEFSSLFPISDILDAIYEGRLHSGTLKNNKGELIARSSGHGLSYYYATQHGFDEMIANFSSISKTSDGEEKLKLLKSIVGDGVYNMIRDFYYNDMLKLDTCEVKSYGGMR